jgi:ABC-type branched-subunit amino acid transport system substrate-binding protein
MFKKIFFVISIGIFFFSSTNPGFCADTIKVGSPVPLTGYFAGDGVNFLNGTIMAIEEINQNGGLLGKKLELVKFDTQDLAPERVMLAADSMVGKEKVDVIIPGWGGWGQDVRAYGKYDVPTFLCDSSKASIEVFQENPEKYQNIYQMVDVEAPAAYEQFVIMAKHLPSQYANKSLAMITTDDPWGIESGNGFRNAAKENGWKVVVDEVVPYGTTSWLPILTKIRKEKPGIIYIEVISVQDQVSFIREFLRRPINALIHVGYAPSLVDFAENIGEDGNGILGLWPPPAGPEYRSKEVTDWVNLYQKKFDQKPAGTSFISYDAVKIWANAVREIGDVKNYKAINHYIVSNPNKMLSVTTADGMGKFSNDNMITIDQTRHPLTQMWDEIYYSLYYGDGEKYKYDFKIPPWIK